MERKEQAINTQHNLNTLEQIKQIAYSIDAEKAEKIFTQKENLLDLLNKENKILLIAPAGTNSMFLLCILSKEINTVIFSPIPLGLSEQFRKKGVNFLKDIVIWDDEWFFYDDNINKPFEKLYKNLKKAIENENIELIVLNSFFTYNSLDKEKKEKLKKLLKTAENKGKKLLLISPAKEKLSDNEIALLKDLAISAKSFAL